MNKIIRIKVCISLLLIMAMYTISAQDYLSAKPKIETKLHSTTVPQSNQKKQGSVSSEFVKTQDKQGANKVQVGKEFSLCYRINQREIKVTNFHLDSLPEHLEYINGPSISTSSSMSVYGGQIEEEVIVTYRYVMKANKEGLFNIPKALFEVDGENKSFASFQIEATPESGTNIISKDIEVQSSDPWMWLTTRPGHWSSKETLYPEREFYKVCSYYPQFKVYDGYAVDKNGKLAGVPMSEFKKYAYTVSAEFADVGGMWMNGHESTAIERLVQYLCIQDFKANKYNIQKDSPLVQKCVREMLGLSPKTSALYNLTANGRARNYIEQLARDHIYAELTDVRRLSDTSFLVTFGGQKIVLHFYIPKGWNHSSSTITFRCSSYQSQGRTGTPVKKAPAKK